MITIFTKELPFIPIQDTEKGRILFVGDIQPCRNYANRFYKYSDRVTLDNNLLGIYKDITQITPDTYCTYIGTLNDYTIPEVDFIRIVVVFNNMDSLNSFLEKEQMKYWDKLCLVPAEDSLGTISDAVLLSDTDWLVIRELEKELFKRQPDNPVLKSRQIYRDRVDEKIDQYLQNLPHSRP